MVVSASWLSRTGHGDGTLNLRGVSTVLALAGFLKGQLLFTLTYGNSFTIYSQVTHFGPRILC